MSSYTFTGPWVNYDRSSIFGATLTLTESGGGFLTAFLGIFIILVGNGFWSILTFVIFETRATKQKVDALHRQQQVILRNSQSPSATCWELFMLPFAWVRRPTDGPEGRQLRTLSAHLIIGVLLKCWTLSVCGLVVFVGWIAAGILSSEASKAAGTSTLIRSYNCGTWEIPSGSNVSVPDAGFKFLSDSITAASYAGLCYGPHAADPQCNKFVKQQIPTSSRTDAPCPFADGWCWYNDSAALELNTGFIDSHEDLGINAPPEDRAKYRRVTTCSVIPPIPNGHYVIKSTNSSTGPIYQYYYGPFSGTSQWTFEYHEIESTFGSGYDLTALFASSGEANNWTPIPQLNTSKVTGDITLIYLAPNGVQSTQPINDPFFTSHIHSSVTTDGVNIDLYGTDYYVHVMACVDQHQFCNQNFWNDSEVASCTSLTGSNLLVDSLDTIGYNPRQLATAQRIQHVLLSDSIYSLIGGRATSALQANAHVYKLLQAPLSNDQWVVEVTSWFTASLAYLQRAIVDFAGGPTNLPPEARIITPTEDGWPIMCKQQKVYSPGTYQNFSILALSLIFGIGGIIIILSWTVEPLINKWREKRNPGNHKRIQWILDNKLQLQRMAYQYINIGKWEKKGEEIPVTVETAEENDFRLPNAIDPSNPGLSSERDVSDPMRVTNGVPKRNGSSNESPV